MSSWSWRDLYHSDAQGLFALLVVPALYLAYRFARPAHRGGVEPAASSFVSRFCFAFAAVALIDPLATGPLARALGAPALGKALLALFVLLGDFRVFLLVSFLAGGRCDGRAALREALLLTPVVPAFALAAWLVLDRRLGGAPGQTLWLAYECAFLAMVGYLRRVVSARTPAAPGPREEFLRSVTGFVALYYGLWAACDALILAGSDVAWGIRALPNQLYYGLLIPFVHARFFARAHAVANAPSRTPG
jgi:hypothetical protein